jgi:hypothetical protein
MRYAVGSLLGAMLALALVATARPAGPLPRLEGPALAGPTHLHLVVSAAPPYIYDVDTNAVRAVATAAGPLDSWVRPSANGAFVAGYGCCTTAKAAYRIHEDGSVQRLASGSSLAPASGSPATWVLRRISPGHCRLARPAQASDAWILDTRTGRYTHLPGFPAQVRLKFSSMAWTSDDRLVLLLEGGGRTVLAVWHPGSRTLPLRPIELPAHTGGSDTFVPLVAP